ncbi:MAG: DegT/DnrJ/EryC1/StrS family aminotransferase [Ruminococcaceae bacterium]|nr:DegT/DnrJ/EryC1/StrS family aminotransferase [Oscillospiraceae bacterium]
MYRIGQEEIDAVAKVINSGWAFKIGGPIESETLLFETELKEKMGCENTVLMTSGQAALTSAMIGMGIGPGDEVIVPAYTYISTAMAVVETGAIPIVAEVDETLTLDASDVEKRITKKTKAIAPVHIQGFPCNMDAIMEIAKKYNLMVIEDACQADGGSYKGKRLGTIGDAGAFSFNQFKIISAGEGGALLTDNKQIFERAMIYHDSSAIAFFGNQLNSFTTELFCGTEVRTNNITAAIMRVQLSRLDGILADLRKNKKYIMDALKGFCTFIPSNDIEGDCGTTVAFRFDTAEETDAFAQKVAGVVPINTGKHIFINWDSIVNYRGALHPAKNPFNMPENSRPSYAPEVCPKTLDYLKRTVYISVNPDATKEQLDGQIEAIKAALK